MCVFLLKTKFETYFFSIFLEMKSNSPNTSNIAPDKNNSKNHWQHGTSSTQRHWPTADNSLDYLLANVTGHPPGLSTSLTQRCVAWDNSHPWAGTLQLHVAVKHRKRRQHVTIANATGNSVQVRTRRGHTQTNTHTHTTRGSCTAEMQRCMTDWHTKKLSLTTVTSYRRVHI